MLNDFPFYCPKMFFTPSALPEFDCEVLSSGTKDSPFAGFIKDTTLSGGEQKFPKVCKRRFQNKFGFHVWCRLVLISVISVSYRNF